MCAVSLNALYLSRAKNFKPRLDEELRMLLKELLRSSPDTSKHKTWNVEYGIMMLKTILQHKRFISSFDLEAGTKGGDLARAILFALIKGATTNLVDQMTIALRFGRIDVVKENILLNDINKLRSRENEGKFRSFCMHLFVFISWYLVHIYL